jgi:hypothetical protein
MGGDVVLGLIAIKMQNYMGCVIFAEAENEFWIIVWTWYNDLEL